MNKEYKENVVWFAKAKRNAQCAGTMFVNIRGTDRLYNLLDKYPNLDEDEIVADIRATMKELGRPSKVTKGVDVTKFYAGEEDRDTKIDRQFLIEENADKLYKAALLRHQARNTPHTRRAEAQQNEKKAREIEEEVVQKVKNNSA